MRTQTERNDGGRYRSLVELTWSRDWCERALEYGPARDADNNVIADQSVEGVRAAYSTECEKIDAAEVAYWLLEPWQRSVAEVAWAEQSEEWDDYPDACEAVLLRGLEGRRDEDPYYVNLREA